MTTSIQSFHHFGDFLRYLRRRARLTQQELGIAVGYSGAQITRLEAGQRHADGLTVLARFVEALGLQQEPELAQQLIQLANASQRRAAQANVSATARENAEGRVVVHSNLPAQLTRFIGREQAVADVRRLLGAHRLVTLTGAGGVGKTRLAIEVGWSMCRGADDSLVGNTSGNPSVFPDGIWFVELAPLSDPALVARAVAGAFRLPEEPGRTRVDGLIAHLRDRRVLVILDNCEHLVAACAELAQTLLQACPALTLLATSRESLGVSGEANWRVPSLRTPDPTHAPVIDQLLDYEAVQLFVEHAALTQPGSTLMPAYTATIAHICHRLDGIPLAIEMAAAQTALMSPQEIAARLDDRFALLSSGRHAALPRHQTLKATIEWSYNLLSEPERVLLAHLSIFADGCTAEIAQAVCPGVLAEGEVLPLLLQLANKSLLVADTRGPETRYRQLETVRHFAAERLDERGEGDAMRERLAEYLLDLAHLASDESHPQEAAPHLARLEAEQDNIRALMGWARDRPDHGLTSMRLAEGLRRAWSNRGNLTERRVWLEEALARDAAAGSPAPAALRAQALTGQLRLLCYQGYNAAPWSAQAEEAVSLSVHVSSDYDRNGALVMGMVAAMDRGDADRMAELAEQSLSLCLRMGFQRGVAIAHRVLGYARLLVNDEGSAISSFQEALRVAQTHELGGQVGSALQALAWMDSADALALTGRELHRQRLISHRGDTANTPGLAVVLQVHGQLLAVAGEHERARASLDGSIDTWRRLKMVWSAGTGLARALLDRGEVAWMMHDHQAARDNFDRSRELHLEAGDLRVLALLHVLDGHTLLALGDAGSASRAFWQGLAHFQALGQPGGMSMALVGLGALAEQGGHAPQAARLYAAAELPRHILIKDHILWPSGHVQYRHVLAEARARLRSPALADAWAEGSRMTIEQAIEFAQTQQR